MYLNDINKLTTIISFIRTFSISTVNPYIGLALNQYYKLPIYLVSIYYLGLTFVTAIGYIFEGYLADIIGRRNSMIDFYICR
jgi:MFS family permease